VTRILFAIPGDIDAPTGVYGYDRRILREAPALGVDIAHAPLPGAFPHPARADVDAALAALAAAALPGDVLLIDGLAGGALPIEGLRRLRLPVIALCHHPLCLEAGLDPARAAQLRDNERRVLAGVAHVVVTSPHTADLLHAQFDVAPDRVTVAVPGTDPAPRARGSGGAPRILAVGAIIPRKGFDLLVGALAALRDLDWRLDIVGSPDHAPQTAQDLRDAIAANGLDSRVTLWGARSGPALDALFDGADLFVSASHYEGYGMALAEALARGLPIVTSTGGAAADTIPDDAALKLAPGDAAALRDALRRAIGEDALRAQLAENAWRAGQALPGWRDAARAIVEAARRVELFAAPD
jgi:glycosyltransferase involved in cell wall biosynthesis